MTVEETEAKLLECEEIDRQRALMGWPPLYGPLTNPLPPPFPIRIADFYAGQDKRAKRSHRFLPPACRGRVRTWDKPGWKPYRPYRPKVEFSAWLRDIRAAMARQDVGVAFYPRGMDVPGLIEKIRRA